MPPCSTSNGFATTRSARRGAGQARRRAEDARPSTTDRQGRGAARASRRAAGGAGAPQRRLEGNRQRHAQQGHGAGRTAEGRGRRASRPSSRAPRRRSASSTRRWPTRWRSSPTCRSTTCRSARTSTTMSRSARSARCGRVRTGHAEHFEIGEALGLMDFERAAKLSGARFTVLKGQLARLERALGQFMLDLHTTRARLRGSAAAADGARRGRLLRRPEPSLPKFDEDLFFTEPHSESSSARHWLIPTAEVPLTNLVREEIVAHESLPRRYTALTPCFRSEAGSAGRDTRGMLRQHQFYKVELVSITDQESSLDRARAHDRLRRGGAEAARPAVPHHGAVHRRHGLRRAQDLRHRGLAAGPERLSRDLVLLGLRRFPGAPHGCALRVGGATRRTTASCTR